MSAKRLIDANKLKVTDTWALVEKDPEDGNAEENNNFTFAPLKCVLLRDIENAPTVEPTFGLFRAMLCETCQAYATNKAIAKLADEYTRPQGMTNAEIFKQTFGIYATELWTMSNADFMEWLNEEVQDDVI